ncbi:MAG: BT_3987 domain-containing protein [Bacteroidales bacterium]
MKYKIGFVTLALSALISGFTSCDDEKDKYLDQYATILYFNKSGEVPVTLYKTGENTNYSVIVNKGGANLKAATEVSAQLMSQASLDIYNEIAGTNYVMLPASCFDMTEKQRLAFSSKEDSKSITVEFITDEIYKLDQTTNYILPMELIDSKDSINSKLNKLFVNPAVVIPSINLKTVGEQDAIQDPAVATTSTFNVTAEMPLKNQWEFDCTLEVDPTILDDFNESSTIKYTLLPQVAYQFNPKLTFTPGNGEVTSLITIDRSKITPGDYILPVRLTDCSKDAFLIDQQKSTCLIKVSLKSIKLTTGNLTTNAQEPTEGAIAGLIDGNLTTFFHSAWSVPASSLPHYFQVRLDTPVKNMKFQYYTRHNSGNQAPKTIHLKGSNDGTNFVLIKTFDSGLPTTSGTAFNTPIFASDVAYSYLRFEVPLSAAGENKFFAMAEFKLWGE